MMLLSFHAKIMILLSFHAKYQYRPS
uniref:Uncharacterized protein n=1 Tax=Arundo donax TaxID=35708 RepID=A0A0A8XYZ9_ARUDO